ncbi:MAG: serine/threonine-protein kinase, partial [Acidimicrobiia bacterium]
MTPVAPGPLAGRYELRERLAASPVAEVLLAHDRDLDRTVAVKVLATDLAADPQVVERFRQAATASATIRDPHVVTVYDWGEDDGTVFVAMEYVDGTNLADTLREVGRLSPDRTAAIGASVAEGLDAAHRAGVVHGGLTPSDVLLASNGDVKICDFGTAAAGLAGFASVGAGVTAAQYAAPEQLQGGPADARSDLYALGSTLYEAVTGAPPYVAADVVSLTERKVRERPAPPSAHATGVPPALDGIIERLLETEPSRRYASGGDVAADLHRLSATLPVPAVGATAPVVVTTVPEAKTSILP